MKRFALLIALLASTCFVNAEVKDTNKKWLDAVQKMVSEGNREISTPNQERVALLKDWARKEGYSVAVTKSSLTYRVEVSKLLVKK